MMDCSEIHSFLHAYIDQEFDQRERLEFELHLAHCPTCRQEVAYYRSLRKKLRHDTCRPVAPVRLETAIRNALQQELRPPLGWFSLSLAAAGAVACALVILWTPDIHDQRPGSHGAKTSKTPMLPRIQAIADDSSLGRTPLHSPTARGRKASQSAASLSLTQGSDKPPTHPHSSPGALFPTLVGMPSQPQNTAIHAQSVSDAPLRCLDGSTRTTTSSLGGWLDSEPSQGKWGSPAHPRAQGVVWGSPGHTNGRVERAPRAPHQDALCDSPYPRPTLLRANYRP